MKVVRASEFSASRAWDSQLIGRIGDATVRLHWTDQPYPWHVNDGAEVFAVLDGVVDMHYRSGTVESVARLEAGDVFHAQQGEAHSARPLGQARVLVIEMAGSV